jgi:hypothetical protein
MVGQAGTAVPVPAGAAAARPGPGRAGVARLPEVCGYFATSALPSAAITDQLPPTPSPAVSPGVPSSTKR